MAATNTDKVKVPVDPVIKKLVDATEDKGPLSELQGYVGPGKKGFVRLYATRSLETYVDIPEETVVYAQPTLGAKDGRMTIALPTWTQVQQVRTTTTMESAWGCDCINPGAGRRRHDSLDEGCRNIRDRRDVLRAEIKWRYAQGDTPQTDPDLSEMQGELNSLNELVEKCAQLGS
jgi:hypothetical protein